jgi:hypothetical protein
VAETHFFIAYSPASLIVDEEWHRQGALRPRRGNFAQDELGYVEVVGDMGQRSINGEFRHEDGL